MPQMLSVSDAQATQRRFGCRLVSVCAGPTGDSGLDLPYHKVRIHCIVLPSAHMLTFPTSYIFSLDQRLTV